MSKGTRIVYVLVTAAVIVGLAAVILMRTNPSPATPPAPVAVPGTGLTVKETPPAPVQQPPLDRAQLAIFQHTGEARPADPAPLVALGKMLFFENRLSKNQDLSCNSCHGLSTYGVDNERFSKGHKGQLGGRNAPTVYNAADHVAQFWDGRAKDLVDQAKGPMMNPVEMAMPDAKRVEAILGSMPEYVQHFEAAFPGEKAPVSLDNAAVAIAAFERTLVTPSRFDTFLAGNDNALTAQEQNGLKLFISSGCTACHNGPNLGGRMFQKVGLVKPWPNLTDEGRAAVTKNDADKFVFRVPTLRNIEKTGPYFHDGSVAELTTAVKMMGEYQLGKGLSDAEVKDVVVFLKSLTGELPKDALVPPELPKSTAKTPRPDPS